MELDVLGLLGACSYALDCVEAELVHVTTFHAKRVAYMSVCTAEQFGVSGEALQDLAVCALLHDNALTQYLHEEFRGDSSAAECLPELPHLGAHCVMGEENISALPFHTNVENIILYHHENADGSGFLWKNMAGDPAGRPYYPSVRSAGCFLPRRCLYAGCVGACERIPYSGTRQDRG